MWNWVYMNKNILFSIINIGKNDICMNVKTLKYSIVVAMVTFLSSSSALIAMEANELGIDKKTIVSKNFRARGGRKVQTLILHCVGLSDEWVSKNYSYSKQEGGLGVSAHYYASRESNKIFQLVSEENSAFHAGVSEWRSLAKDNGLQGLNDISIGIEFQSPGYGQINGEGYYPYKFASYGDEQIESGIRLSKKIMEQHNISAENVVWHSDISPLRANSGSFFFGKTDPGALFDGKTFAEKGIGVWPSSVRLEDGQLDTSLKAIQAGLVAWGYPHVQETGVFDEPTKYVLTAHYMHYLPTKVNWADYKEKQSGSIFDEITDWKDFPYSEEALSISLENLNRKNFEFKI